MNKKIINIAMTLFMLLLCSVLMITFRLVNIQRNLDLNTDRADQSVLSIDGSVTDGAGARVSGATIISAIKYASEIPEYSEYKIQLGGTTLTPDNVESNITADSQYVLRYAESSESIVVTVEGGG